MNRKPIAVIVMMGILLVLCSSQVLSQVWARVDGTVKSEDGKPIEGAKIIMIFVQDKGKHEFVTDDKGQWRTVNVRGGTWTIGFMAKGFEPQNLNVVLSVIKKNPTIHIRLAPVKQTMVNTGDKYYEQGKYLEALKEYRKLLMQQPDMFRIHEKIGLCYYRQGDLQKAIVSFKQVLEKDPKAQNVLTNLSAILLEKGYLDEGLKYFKQLDEASVKDHSTFYNIGVLLFKNEKMDLAIQYFKKCVARNPKYANGYYQMALAYLNKGNMENAKKGFLEVIRLEPDSENGKQSKNMLEALK
jgi:Tfp pilus assembly protein PilF